MTHELAVIRSTWDYAKRHEEFMSRAAATGELTSLHNPVAMLSWNTDKRYLSQLANGGRPVIDTAFHPPGSTWAVAELSHPVVVKPSVVCRRSGHRALWH